MTIWTGKSKRRGLDPRVWECSTWFVEISRVEPHLRSDVKSIRAWLDHPWNMAASCGTRINLPESRHSKSSKIKAHDMLTKTGTDTRVWQPWRKTSVGSHTRKDAWLTDWHFSWSPFITFTDIHFHHMWLSQRVPYVPTRHTESYANLRARTDAYKFSFLPRSIRAWNSLPPEIIAIQNPDSYRNAIATALRKGTIEMTNITASSNNYKARTDIPIPYFKEGGWFSGRTNCLYSVTALFLRRNPGHNVKTTLIKTIVKVKVKVQEKYSVPYRPNKNTIGPTNYDMNGPSQSM